MKRHYLKFDKLLKEKENEIEKYYNNALEKIIIKNNN